MCICGYVRTRKSVYMCVIACVYVCVCCVSGVGCLYAYV